MKTNSLQLFDFNMLKLVKDLTFQQSGDGEYLYCTKFANEVTVLSGGSGTNSAQAININTNEVSVYDVCDGGDIKYFVSRNNLFLNRVCKGP